MRAVFLALGAMLLGVDASAQNLEEVVVTGLRASDYSEMPAVTITKPADFLVQKIQLINDSRSPDLRKKEIIETVEGMLKRSTSGRNIALSYGEGFLVPVNLTEESLQIIEDKKRPDTSRVEIYVKVTLAAGDDTKARIAALRKFIEKTPLVGRTEVEPMDDVGLSIVGPEKYRYDILARIAEENARLAKVVGSKCEVKVSGLSRRVMWERTEVAELMLYIPYEMEMSHCMYE